MKKYKLKFSSQMHLYNTKPTTLLLKMYIKKTAFLFLLIIGLSNCKKEKTFLYELNPVQVNANGNIKNNVKSTTEFISIAYADLKGSNISSSELQNLSIVYTSFGDKKLIEDRIIRKFLIDANTIIPIAINVNGDTTIFVINTYKKFFNREPDDFEKYYYKEFIRANAGIDARMIYYSMMTSDEYRYY